MKTRVYFSLLCFTAIWLSAEGRDLLQSNATSLNTTTAWFCREGPCNPYQLLKTLPNYEIRQYPNASQWIQSTATGANYTQAFQLAFTPLYQYLNNFNSANLTISSGGAAVSLTNFSDSSNVTRLTTYFSLLPAQLNGTTAPRPLNQNLTFYYGPNSTFGVGSFPGFADQATFITQASYLRGNLTADGIKFIPQLFTVIYDSPLRTTNRHNEVWYELQDYLGSRVTTNG